MPFTALVCYLKIMQITISNSAQKKEISKFERLSVMNTRLENK